MRFIIIALVNFICTYAFASDMLPKPYLLFSDIKSGPSTGIGDNIQGSQGIIATSGAIVTVWGYNLKPDNNPNNNIVNFTDASGITNKAYIYYWKKADGELPGGPANLFSSHRLWEICFSIPKSNDGVGRISVFVNGNESENRLPFTIRPGNIYHVKQNNGNDTTGTGSFLQPWKSLDYALSGRAKIKAGDIVYTHDVKATTDINVGYSAPLVGSKEAPFSVISYPGTFSSATGATVSNFRNWGTANYYWNFSKFDISTNYQAFSLFQGSRIVGNRITGPQINKGYSGWIGGGCANSTPNHCGGHYIYGNEVYKYGIEDGTVDQFQHLFYISNRSGKPAEGYEIAYNNLHDNYIYQGIHIYDQEPCGGWSSPINIHHNAIINQGGNAINVNFNCPGENTIRVNIAYNYTSISPEFKAKNLSIPQAGLRIEVPSTTEVYVANNTFDASNSSISISGGADRIFFKNNLIVNASRVPFTTGYRPDATNILLLKGTTIAFSKTNLSPAFSSELKSIMPGIIPPVDLYGNIIDLTQERLNPGAFQKIDPLPLK